MHAAIQLWCCFANFEWKSRQTIRPKSHAHFTYAAARCCVRAWQGLSPTSLSKARVKYSARSVCDWRWWWFPGWTTIQWLMASTVSGALCQGQRSQVPYVPISPYSTLSLDPSLARTRPSHVKLLRVKVWLARLPRPCVFGFLALAVCPDGGVWSQCRRVSI